MQHLDLQQQQQQQRLLLKLFALRLMYGCSTYVCSCGAEQYSRHALRCSPLHTSNAALATNSILSHLCLMVGALPTRRMKHN